MNTLVFFPGCGGWGRCTSSGASGDAIPDSARCLHQELKKYNFRLVPVSSAELEYDKLKYPGIPKSVFPGRQCYDCEKVWHDAFDRAADKIEHYIKECEGNVVFVGLSQGADLLMGALRRRRTRLIAVGLAGRCPEPRALLLCGGPFAYAVDWEKKKTLDELEFSGLFARPSELRVRVYTCGVRAFHRPLRPARQRGPRHMRQE